jgi:hypothetical protein
MTFPTLALLFILSSSLLHARVINVPDDFENIQAGIDEAEDGDTVLVAPGVYEENITTAGKGNLTIGSLTLTTGDPDFIAETIIDGGGEGAAVTFMNMQRDVRITLQGFTIRNGNNSPGGGIEAGMAIHAELSDLVVTGNVGHGIAAYGIWDVHLRRVRISDNIGSGIWISAENASLEDCEISNNNRGGGSMDAVDLTLTRVSFIDNVGSGLALGPRVRRPVVLDHLTIARTRMQNDQGGMGLKLYAQSGSDVIAHLTNSIISSNEGSAIVLREGPENSDVRLTVDFSDIEGGRDNIEILEGGEPEIVWLEGNIDADPLFVDPDNDDYHLTADSPCIDTGDPEADPDPDGTQADMGAFYFHQRDIDVDPDTLEFSGVQTGTVDSLGVTVRNVGLTTLSLTSVSIVSFDAPLDVDELEEALPIEPDSSHTIWIRFLPFEENQYLANLIIESDDPDEAIVEVLISASALSVSDDRQNPTSFGITGVYPNPFNSTTSITFQTANPSQVSLAVYDLNGRLVDVMIDERLSGGIHAFSWQPESLASGLYIVRLDAGGMAQTRKVVLMR